MKLLSLTTNEVLVKCKELQDCENEVNTLFISSYPKSGTTWVQAVIYNLLSNGNQDFKHISYYSPFFEIENTWTADSQQQHFIYQNIINWRVYNTHLLWHMMPKKKNMKYIYIVRSGKDVALSFFKHLSSQDDADCYGGSLEDFLIDWSEGKIVFGCWVDHLKSWLEAYHNKEGTVDDDGLENKILLVRYEDMICDMASCMKRIVSYLGLKNITDERIGELLQFVSFEYMKEHQEQFMPISVPWKEGYNFIREGKVGDNVNHFKEEHYDIYNKMIQSIYPNSNDIPTWLKDLNIL